MLNAHFLAQDKVKNQSGHLKFHLLNTVTHLWSRITLHTVPETGLRLIKIP